MIRLLGKRLKALNGFTLVEALVAVVITGIAMTGLLVAYTDGVRYVRDASDEMVMYNEGMSAMDLMRRFIRLSNRAKIKSYAGNRNSKLELNYPDDVGGGRAEFYFMETVHELRWNNRAANNNKFNMRLLPMVSFRRPIGDDPYMKVKDCKFTPLDFIGTPSPLIKGYGLIKIELVLEDEQGDTLYLSSVSSKRNRL